MPASFALFNGLVLGAAIVAAPGFWGLALAAVVSPVLFYVLGFSQGVEFVRSMVARISARR